MCIRDSDRIDLEDQITGDFTRADIPNIESAKTKDELVAFFKQKTAYEIMSGDWSSDVCSSDLKTD